MAMPRMPSSRGMRPESRGTELDAVRNGGLHAIEEEKAAEKNERDGESRSEQQQAGGLAAASDGPAEAVNDTSHGIEAIEPTPGIRDERRRICHRRGEHPELNDKRDDISDVAIESVERGEPQADAKSGEEREEQKHGQPESCKRGEDAVRKTENGSYGDANGEIDQAGKSGGDGENKPREIDFGDKPLVLDDHVRCG